MSRLSRFGFVLAALVFVLDRASKWWILEVLDLPERDSVPVLPFLDLTMVWNRGISMGMFQADSEVGRYALIVLTGAVAIGLSAWLYRVSDRLLSVALGLVVGGALGNIWDRVAYGAVADFIRFFVDGWSFYVFNIADSAITVGVALLLWDALPLPQKPHKTAD